MSSEVVKPQRKGSVTLKVRRVGIFAGHGWASWRLRTFHAWTYVVVTWVCTLLYFIELYICIHSSVFEI